jgi:hypothetical protein
MPKRKKTVPARAKKVEENLLDLLTIKSGGRRRPLSDDEARLLVMMLTINRDPLALDIQRLVPKGSFLARVARHFDDTDISYALPVFQTVMIAASHLLQNGARLQVEGVGEILPSLWTIALAESGSAKTLAAGRIMSIFGEGDGVAPMRTLPSPGSDAQWIVDLADENGAFWFQDEVGKFFNNVLKNKMFSRIKPWMLSAYSHEPISNRLKSDAHKLEIRKPAFTFFGLSVFSTWRDDVDAVSMLDGFCQRPNYVIATARQDTSIFDHFIYFAGGDIAAKEAELREIWQALCAQPGATDVYTLQPDVLPYLQRWWSGLRDQWGDGGVPASFIRRIGFSVLRYLMVLHFLLGKSRHPIDVETAYHATRYAEYHLESTREMLRAYDRNSAARVRKIVEVRNTLNAEGKDATPREIHRRLGKAMRDGLTADVIKAIVSCLDRVDLEGDAFPATHDGRKAKSGAIAGRADALEQRLQRNERKRNERRLRNLRASCRAGERTVPDSVTHDLDEAGVPICGTDSALSPAGALPAEAVEHAEWFDEMFGMGAGDERSRTATVLPFRLGGV